MNVSSGQGYEFRITLRRDQVSCSYDTPTATDVSMDSKSIRRSEHLETIEVLGEWLRRWEWIARYDKNRRLLVPETFRVLGDHLWDLALSEVPGQVLLDAITAASHAGNGSTCPVRVRMTFDADALDLATLPWEFVHGSPAGSERKAGFFLATETNLTLGRYVHGRGDKDADFRSPDDKLRVLFVIALPDELDFDEDRREIRSLVSTLRATPGDDGDEPDSNLYVELVDGWKPTKVAAKLAEFKSEESGARVDVVHLVALFRQESGKSQLYLPDPDRNDRWGWTDASPVVTALTERGNQPKLVVLHLSEVDDVRIGEPEHFEQLAPDFIQADIPAVLAMQYPMRPRGGRDFVRKLYTQLGQGDSIGTAVQETRRELHNGKDRYFGTPALYMQSRVDGSLVARQIKPKPESVAQQQRPSARANRAAPNSRQPSKLVDELLKQVRAMPETPATEEVITWLEEQPWPVSLAKEVDRTYVDDQFKLQQRALNDDADWSLILRTLVRRVDAIGRRPAHE